MIKRLLLIPCLLLTLYLLVACTKKEANTSVTPTGGGSTPVITDSTLHTYLALGDSYTIGQSVAVTDRFPVQTTLLLKQQGILFANPEIIATTGWTTANLISALQSTPPKKPVYDMVTLLIGVNNQYQGRSQQEYSAQFDQLLNTALQYAGNKKNHVIVLSIPDWSVTPYASGYNRQLIAAQIDSFNLINKQITAQRGVGYVDVTPASRMAATDPTLVAGDGLHPSGKQYALWAAPLAAMIKTNL